MRILLSGASGLLGTAMRKECGARGLTCDALDRSQIEWRGIERNAEILRPYDVFVHAAANTNVEQCETDIFNCYRDNAFLTEKLAKAAQLSKAKFVYISSTGVYGNSITGRPYTEYDAVAPTTHHHRAKLSGEYHVSNTLFDHLIIRTGWLFGAESGHTDFVSKIVESVEKTNGSIKSNSQQIGVPTYVGDVARMLLDLIETGETGLFNLVNEGEASRFDYVKTILENFALDVEVIPAMSADFKRVAPVSDNESAINFKLSMAGYEAMPNWRESLFGYISSVKAGRND